MEDTKKNEETTNTADTEQKNADALQAENEKLKAELEKLKAKQSADAGKGGKPAKSQTGKKVKIKIPLTRTEKDDVFVGLNGKTYLIKRGEEVEVPVGVAKILQRKEKMLAIAMEFEAQAAQPLEELAKQK